MTSTPWQDGALLRDRGRDVLFGFGYDDERVELETFHRPGDVLAIAGSGEVPAALAAAGHRVTAIDINPVQLAYARARVDERAPAHIGSAERLLDRCRGALSLVAPAWRRTSRTELLSMPPDQAITRWRSGFANPWVRGLVGAVLGSGRGLGALMPGSMTQGIPKRFAAEVFTRMDERIAADARENRFLHRLIVGSELPRWTTATPIHPIEWLEGDVVELMASRPKGFDWITLSNVADATPPGWRSTLEAAARGALRPGGVAMLRAITQDGDDAARAMAHTDRCGLWGTITLWES